MGILLALQFQGDYSTEQHHCSKNYYGDNFCVAVQEELCVNDLSQFWAIAVHVISDSFSCQHEKPDMKSYQYSVNVSHVSVQMSLTLFLNWV